MGLDPQNLMEIRSKDGIQVFRFESGGAHLVIKLLERETDRRELKNYRLLAELGLETLPVLGQADKALVLPDLNWDPVYRLGEEADLQDLRVAAALGQWYRKLHRVGKAHVRDHGKELYDEADLLTWENLEQVRQRTGTADEPFWAALFGSFDGFCRKVQKTAKTVTYNDFYYTNLVVARDRSTAFPFDYNLMGKGCVLADLRNVTYYMETEAQKAFYEAYGPVDETDRLYDAVVSPLVTLVLGCRAEKLPDWTEEEIEKLHTGELLKAFERFMEE